MQDFTEAHKAYLERQFQALLQFHPSLRARVLEDDATPMSKGGRGIYSEAEAKWMRDRLQDHRQMQRLGKV